MILLEEMNTALTGLVPVETGGYSDRPPDVYAVITPMADDYELFADDTPQAETQSARLSLYHKGSYTALKNSIVAAFLGAGLTITDRRYVMFERDTGYHHYAIDVMKDYYLEED